MKGKILTTGLYGIGFAILSVIIIWGLTRFLLPQIFDKFEARMLDWRYEKRIKKKWEQRKGATIDDIVVINIDDRSLEKLNRFETWPRSYHARIIDYVNSGGAVAIGFDVLFLEHGSDKSSDDSLKLAVRQARNVYLAMSFSYANPDAFIYRMSTPPKGLDIERLSYNFVDSTHNVFKDLDRIDGKFVELYNASAGIGFANFFSTSEHVIRKMPLFINFAGRQYPSLAMAMVLGLMGANNSDLKLNENGSISLTLHEDSVKTQKIDLRTGDEGKMLIDYEGSYRTFRYVSYYDVLAKRIPPEFFRNKIVLIGATAAGLYEWRPVPFQATFPGVEIHANLIYGILNRNFIKQSNSIATLFISLLLSMIVAVCAIHFRPFLSILGAVSLGVVFSFVNIKLFTHYSVWLEALRPIQVMVITYMIVIIYRFMSEEKDKRIIKHMFNHYLSPTVVNELLKNRDQLKPGGKRTVATVLFSDVKSFTTVAENLNPEELVTLLNEYLSVMTEIVLEHNGFLDKYEGDAIMAIFGVPLPKSDHAYRACLAALDMQRRLAELRIKWELEKRPLLEMRIGMNLGPMIAGNIGGENRVDYTVIGDSVNLASRLEGANKIYGTSIIISEDTYDQVKDEFLIRELDFIQVKGKKKPVRIYELISKKDEALDENLVKVLDLFSLGLSTYRRGNWECAYNHFQRALRIKPDDGPSREFFNRCKGFMDQRTIVPTDWDGVYEMMTK